MAHKAAVVKMSGVVVVVGEACQHQHQHQQPQKASP